MLPKSTTRTVISLVAVALLLGVSTSAVSAETQGPRVIQENGMPVTLAEVGFRYRSSLSTNNRDTVVMDDGTRVELWKIQGQRGDCLDIAMRSEEIDSRLLVLTGSGTSNRSKLADDDDSGGGANGRDARVRVTLPANGSYYIVAAAASREDSVGQYALEVASCSGASAPSRGPAGSPSAGDGGQNQNLTPRI
jgi:hypothetical protein